MEILVLVFLLVSTLSAAAAAALAQEDTFVGVNIGTKVSSMPDPAEVAALLKSQKIEHVRLYDADHDMLVALANTTIKVAVSVPNDQILGISQSNTTAAKWVSQNVLTHYPSTNITTICVGTDVLTSMPNATTLLLLLLPNALKHIHLALVAANLGKQIKISTPLPSTIIFKSFPFPPSQAYFNRSLINPLLLPLLKFLQSTNSPFMINMYPYLEHVQSNDVVSLDYALFKPLPVSKQPVDTNTSLRYSNAFDAMVDAAYSAMASLNITDVRVVVAETGWPSEGAEDEADATSDNARAYNTNLIKHVMNRTGTPRHPGIAVSTYIYELYNEALSERNWGLFEADGESVYAIKFSGSDLAAAGNESTSRTYCTAKAGADEKMVQAALDWACGAGKVDCWAMMAGQPCFEPDTLAAHATYAFDSYYQQMGRAAGSCDFNGVAAITSTAPSGGMCVINSGNGSDKNGSSPNSTVPPAMDSDDSSASSASGGYGDAFEASKFVIGLIGCVAALLI